MFPKMQFANKSAELKRKHYSELTPQDWNWLREQGIVNGYGPSSQAFLRWTLARIAPAFNLSNADIHDFTYWQGGDEAQRIQCDRGFFVRLCEDSLDTGWGMLYYVPLSLLYYGALRLLGKKYFKYQ